MIALIAIAVVLLLGAGVWRWRTRDTGSVENYRETLRTLSELSRRAPLLADELTKVEHEEGVVATPATHLVFEDGALRSPEALPRTQKRDRALAAMNRRGNRHTGSILLVVVVALALISVGIVGAHDSNKKKKPTATTLPTHHHGKTTTTTTTTAPATLRLLSQSTKGAIYRAPGETYTVTISATGTCWVGVTTAAGATLLNQTLNANTSKTISVTGAATLIVGVPNAISITVNGEAMQIPTGILGPYSATLIESTAAPTSSTTSSTVTTTLAG